MTHSEELRGKMELTSSGLLAAYGRLWSQPELDRLYPGFLLHLHFIMRASVPLMVDAAAVAERSADPTSPALAAYLRKHIPEERDHDVWTLDDLTVLGWSREAVLAEVPPIAIAAMVGAAYYWVHHVDPVALLGYIAVLEATPPSAAHIDRLERTTGLPPEAFRTYRKHGQLDPVHRDELDRLLDQLPLTRRQAGLVGIAASHTALRLAEAMDDLASSAAPARSGARRRPHSSRTSRTMPGQPMAASKSG